MAYEPQIVKEDPIFGVKYLSWSERPKTLIEGFLPSKGVVFIAASPHTGKTFLAIEMARAVSTGTPFLGQYATKQGRVLFIEEDAADWDFRTQYEKITGEELTVGDEKNLTDIHSDSVAMSLKQIKWLDSDEFTRDLAYWANQNYQYLGEEGEKEIIEEGFNLIILDSLAAMHSQEENDNNVMHAIVNRARLLSEKTNSCVVVLHHVNKASGDHRSEHLSLDRLRGASSITAAADCIFGLYKKHRFASEISLLMLKNRAFPESQDITYYFKKTNDRVFLTTSSTEKGTTSYREELITAQLRNSPSSWVDTTFLTGLLMAEEEADTSKLKTYQGALYKILGSLEGKGQIERRHGKVRWKGATPTEAISGDQGELNP